MKTGKTAEFWLSVMGLSIRLGSMVARFGLLTFLGRKFLTGEFGEYSLVQSSITLGIYLIGLDLYTFTNRELPKDKNNAGEIIKNQFAVHLIAYMVFLPVILPLLSGTFIPAKYIFIFGSLVILEHISMEFIRILIALQHPLFANLLIFSKGVLWITAFMITATLNHSLLSLGSLLHFWVTGLVISVLAGITLLIKVKVLPFQNLSLDYGLIKKSLRASALFLSASLLHNFMMFSGRYFLKYYYSAEEVGILSFYQSLTDIIEIFLYTLFVMIFLPKIIETRSKGDGEGFRRNSSLMFGGIMYGALLISLCLILLGKPFFYFIGKDEMLAHYPVFCLLVLANCINCLFLVSHYILYIYHNDRAIALSALAGAFMSFGLSLLLVPRFGLSGAVFSFIGAVGTMGLFKTFSAFKSQPTGFKAAFLMPFKLLK